MTPFRALPDNLKGAVLLMVAAAGFSIMVTLIKLVGQRLPVTQILFMRQLGMMVMLLPTLASGFPGALKTQRPGLQMLRLALALVAMMAGFTAIVNMPLADAIAIGFAKSFFITIFAVVVLHEVVGLHRWGAVAVGFAGVLVMLRPGGESFTVYALLALGGAAAAGAVMVVIRLLSRTEPPMTIMAYQALGVGLVMLIPASIYWVQPTTVEWLILAGIGFVAYFSQKANIYAFKFGEASMLASLDYVRLLYTAVLGYWLFSELPSTSTWVGAGIIVLASIYTVRREALRAQSLACDPNARAFLNQ